MITHVQDGPADTGVLIVVLPAVAKVFYRLFGIWGALDTSPGVIPVIECNPVRFYDGGTGNIRIVSTGTGTPTAQWPGGVWHPRKDHDKGLYVIDGVPGSLLQVTMEAGGGGPGEGTMHGVIKYELVGP